MGFFQNSGMSNDVFNVSFQNGVEFRYNSAYCFFQGCTNFNSPVKIPDSIQDGGFMFSGCTNFNSNVYIDPYESQFTRMNQMFEGDELFNKNINIPYNCGGIYHMLPHNYNATLHVYSLGSTYYNQGEEGNFYEYFGFMNGNFNVAWYTNPISLNFAFVRCYELNTNINIPISVRELNNAFTYCYNLNKNIRLHDRSNARGCFYGCNNLNQNIKIPRLGCIVDMFSFCSNLNQPMYIPEVNGNNYFEQRQNVFRVFGHCNNLNSRITIDTNLKSIGGLFESCANYNLPLNIPSNIQDMYGTFYECYNFDQEVILPDGLICMDATFQGAYNFSHYVEIPSTVRNMRSTFASTAISGPVTIPSGVEDLTWTFSGCRYLNGRFTIPESVTMMAYTFSNCNNLRVSQPIPSGVVNMTSCFYGCTNLDVTISIPSTVRYMDSCFGKCSNLNHYISIPNNVICQSLFVSCVNYKQDVIVNHNTNTWYTSICANTQVPNLTLMAPTYNRQQMNSLWTIQSDAIHSVIANARAGEAIFNLILNGDATYPDSDLTIRDYFGWTGVGPRMVGITNIHRVPQNYSDYVQNYRDKNYLANWGGISSSWMNSDDGGMLMVYYDYPNASSQADVPNHAYHIRMKFV